MFHTRLLKAIVGISVSQGMEGNYENKVQSFKEAETRQAIGWEVEKGKVCVHTLRQSRVPHHHSLNHACYSAGVEAPWRQNLAGRVKRREK
jgi:hypothetical protein